MPDAAQQLARLHAAGFSVEQFERFPQAVGVLRDGCVALLQPTPAGLQRIGAAGWRMGEVMGVLVQENGQPVFRAKSESLPATPERLEALRSFERDLGEFLAGSTA
jgi:hypothetical protein